MKKGDIAIYYFPGSGSSEEWVALDDYDIEKDGETGALVVYFHTAVETRYLKVSSIWDDRDADNQSVFAFATFTNNVADLFRVWTLSTSHTESYEYDAIGNRVSLNSDGTVSGNEYYKNSENGNTCRIRKDGEWYYLYDKAGNRVRKGRAVTGTGDNIAIDPSEEHWSYTWDLHNRLVRVESSTGVSVSYAYDAQNHRVKREGKDGTTVYAYGRNGALTYQKNLTSELERSYTYLGNTLLGWTETVDGESHKFFAVTDALGSVTQIRDEENTVVWDGEYAPFGTLTAAVGKKRFDGMFTGKDIDPETGLTYHWHRWRSEDGTSFISEDPARDGINWYGYAGANPLRWIDPTGLEDVGLTQGPTRESDRTNYDNNGKSNPATENPESPEESESPEAAPAEPGIDNGTESDTGSDPGPSMGPEAGQQTEISVGPEAGISTGPSYITGNNAGNNTDPWGLTQSDAQAALVNSFEGMPPEFQALLGLSLQRPVITPEDNQSTLKTRLVGAGTAIGGLGLTVVSAVLIEKSAGNAPQELGTAFVIGVQATLLGVTQAVTGEDLLGNLIELIKPAAIDAIKAIGDFNKSYFYNWENLKS